MLNGFQERLWYKKIKSGEKRVNNSESPQGHVNEAFTPTTPLTRTEMVLSKVI